MIGRISKNRMALESKTLLFPLSRLVLTLLLLVATVSIASLGGFLNRCRGGYVQYGHHMDYWPAHIVSRQTFSLATGLLVLIFGCHLRAGSIVWWLTQWSLYISWGSYMMIGEDTSNYKGREGIVDWMFGRQEMGWNFTQRFIREYSGMSLRGLIWTAPQGYALQQLGFGWQYSLSGSLMSIVYFAGGRSHIPDGELLSAYLDNAVSFSEFYWGSLVWFVLIVSCLTQLVYRIRKWVESNSASTALNICCEIVKYESLNHIVAIVLYNVFFVIFWLVLAASIVFYSLIIQTDIRNKGQTFFGLFTALVAMTILLSWSWSAAYTKRILENDRKQQQNIQKHSPTRRMPVRINDIDSLEKRGYYDPSETDRLLPWPYSHPDKGFMDSRKSQRLDSPSQLGFNNSPSLSRQPIHRQPFATHSQPYVAIVIKIWTVVEKFVYLDIFALIRHFIGLVSLLSIIFTIVLCFISVIWDSHVHTFDPQYYVCVNSSVWNNT